MSINNSRDFLDQVREWGIVFTEHTIAGRNVQLAPNAFPYVDGAPSHVATFTGTNKADVLFAGGGEGTAIFMGTKGDDLYGTGSTTEEYGAAFVDYSGAKHGIVVDMTWHGSRTFTDADGATRTTDIVGRAYDGFGGIDYFAATPDDYWFGGGVSGVYGVFGSSHRDVMVSDDSFSGEFYGGRGNDLLVANFVHGGIGNDLLVGVANTWGYGSTAWGDEGNDVLRGTLLDDYLLGGTGNDVLLGGAGEDHLEGGTGNDVLRAGDGADGWVTGEAGNDLVDGGAGNDFLDGGVGRDTLLSGAGNDTINPDVEFFQSNSSQPTDGARDKILVTRDDLGDYTDTILFKAFEEGIDRIYFADAVRGGAAFRVTHETTAGGNTNTVLQIDQDRDGFGDTDYQLVVAGADLSLHHGYWLT